MSTGNNDQSRSGISSPLDLTNRIIKIDDQHSNCGGFSNVHRCWYDESEGVRKEVAVKCFRFKPFMDEDHSDKMIRRELGIWRRLNHGNIDPFLGITYGFDMSGALSLVSLWMPNGTLHGFLAQYDHSVARGLELLLDIANGLNYLHSFPTCPIVHGDLSSNNVLVDENYTARLADFGHASLVGSIPEDLSYLRLATGEGTWRSAAPESVLPQEGQNMTTKRDIYSFGSISLQVLSGKLPWSEIEEESRVILCLAQGLNPARPEHRRISDQHWDFIQQCWSSAQKRPSAESIIASIQLFLNNPRCEWRGEDGITCGKFVTPADVRTHFSEQHGIGYMGATAQLTCAWVGCGRSLRKGYFVRHVVERHLGVKRSIAHSSH